MVRKYLLPQWDHGAQLQYVILDIINGRYNNSRLSFVRSSIKQIWRKLKGVHNEI